MIWCDRRAEQVCTSQVLKYVVIARAVIDNDVKNNVPSPNTINKCVVLLKSKCSYKALRYLFSRITPGSDTTLMNGNMDATPKISVTLEAKFNRRTRKKRFFKLVPKSEISW